MNDFTIDGRAVDVETLSDNGKFALQKAVNLNQQISSLEEQKQDLTLLINHYASLVKEEMPEEEEGDND